MSRALWCGGVVVLFLHVSVYAQALPGTKLLDAKEDFARVMVDGIGKYLDRETAASVEKRKAYWKPDYSSAKSVAPARLSRSDRQSRGVSSTRRSYLSILPCHL